MTQPRILFVCLGNICRSPVAAALFRRRAEEAGLEAEADSAGTERYHIGEPAQPGSVKVAEAAGLDLSDHRARRVAPKDFRRFTHIIALDGSNKSDLKRIAPSDATASVERLMHYSDRPEKHVLDPYMQGDEAFAEMFAQLESGIRGLIAELKQTH